MGHEKKLAKTFDFSLDLCTELRRSHRGGSAEAIQLNSQKRNNILAVKFDGLRHSLRSQEERREKH